jgi:basic membrane protein A
MADPCAGRQDSRSAAAEGWPAGGLHLRQIIVLLVILTAFAGCSGGSSPNGAPSAGAGPRLAMVTDIGGLGDKSFNDSAHRGLTNAASKLHATVTVLQSHAFTDYEPNLSTLAQQHNDLIVAVGYLMHDALDSVAARFPSSHFAIIDSVVDRPNVTSVTFKEEESSFLAGVAAALASKKHVVAFLGGIDSPLIEKFYAGYEAGVESANPFVKVLVKYTGSFDDVAAGKEYASLLFQQGADVIYVAAGKCGLGAIDEVKAMPAGNFIIGVDSDQDGLAPGKVLTSALKHVDNAVYQLAVGVAAGKSPAGHLVLGLKEGGVGITDMPYTRKSLPRDGFTILDGYRHMIMDGGLLVPSTPAELATFKRPVGPFIVH